MKHIAVVSLGCAMLALTLSGCVTETVAPELHTSAYVGNDADSASDSNARTQPNAAPSAATGSKPSAPSSSDAVASPPAPPIPGVPPPPVLH